MSTTGKDQRSIEELIASHRPGYSLEHRFYTDPDIYTLELERVVYRNWILIGHSSEWAQADDFRVINIASESAIVVRRKNGELAGYANVCRHRGSRVCLEESGSSERFSCPYHGWSYDTDGRLVAARSMPEDFDYASHSLLPVSVGEVHGLVFVCLSDDPPSLDGCRDELAAPMAQFDFPNLKVAARNRYAIPANWKLTVENYQECYHCATSHPEYAQMHTLMLDPVKRARVQDRMREKMPSCGLQEFNVERVDLAARPGEIGYGYSRTALFDRYKTGSKDGQPVAPLLGDLKDYDGGGSDFTFGAFSFLLAYSDHIVCYVFTPVDHQNSQCEITWLVRGDAQAGKDYDVDDLVWLWDITTAADQEIITNNSKGVLSKYYRPGPLSRMERAEGIYLDWLLQELNRP